MLSYVGSDEEDWHEAKKPRADAWSDEEERPIPPPVGVPLGTLNSPISRLAQLNSLLSEPRKPKVYGRTSTVKKGYFSDEDAE